MNEGSTVERPQPVVHTLSGVPSPLMSFRVKTHGDSYMQFKGVSNSLVCSFNFKLGDKPIQKISICPKTIQKCSFSGSIYLVHDLTLKLGRTSYCIRFRTLFIRVAPCRTFGAEYSHYTVDPRIVCRPPICSCATVFV